jgi:hypothetical protein
MIEIIDNSWPDYARRAAGHRNLSSLSIPLLIERTSGCPVR